MEVTNEISAICSAKRFDVKATTLFLQENNSKIGCFAAFALQNDEFSWRATWTLSKLDKKNFALLQPYTQQFIDSLTKIKKQGHIRETLKVISKLPLTEAQTCELIDFCFLCLNNNKMQGSVKSTAMSTLLNIGKNFPELQDEAISIFADTEDYYSRGMRHSINLQITKIQNKNSNIKQK